METIEETQDRFEGSDPWEGDHNKITDGRIAFCRISSVNAEQRTCTIKTYGSDPNVDNGDFENIQWLNPYSSLEGDEVSFVPEIGVQGLCIFAGGVPWIIGFFNPVTLDDTDEIPDLEGEGVLAFGASAASNKEKINAGDQIMRTAGRNRILLRRGGEIEIEATKLCRRTYFPAQNLVNDLSQNYEFRTDGGTIDWTHINTLSDKTIYTQEWRDSVKRENIIIDQKGTVDVNSELIHRFAIGPLKRNLDFKPVFIRETLNTGETEFKINETAYTEKIERDGGFTQGIGGFTFFKDIRPTGEVTVNVNNNIQTKILPSGELTMDIGIEAKKKENEKPEGGEGKFKLNIKPDGTIKITINKKIEFSMTPDGVVKVDTGPGKATATMTAEGDIKFEGKTLIEHLSEKIDLKGAEVILGSSPADTVPMGKLLLVVLTEFIQRYNTHFHNLAIPITGPTLAPEAPGIMKTPTSDILSQTVKVQS